MRYYLIGGAVRDILLGRTPREFDIAFSGDVDDFLRRHGERVHIVGKSTSVYIVDGREYSPLHNGSLAEDLANRDLTINALALDENGILHCLPDSLADLADGIIRHASPRAFLNDHTRVLRAARLSATLEGFKIHHETENLMQNAASSPEYGKIAAERAGKECMKAMAGYAPSNFLRALARVNALEPWFEPMEKARAVPAGPPKYHGENSVFEHTCEVMDTVASMPYSATLDKKDRALAVWMALCHDLGKLETPAAQWPRHIGHESRGLRMAEGLASSLRLPTLWAKAARIAISLHMKAGQYAALKRKTRVELLHTLNVSGLFAPFCALVMADSRDSSLADAMRDDLNVVLSVSLPHEWRDKGEKSAAKLRELRVAALPRK